MNIESLTIDESNKLLEDNNRLFLLMSGYGKTNVFKYLNKEFIKIKSIIKKD